MSKRYLHLLIGLYFCLFLVLAQPVQVQSQRAGTAEATAQATESCSLGMEGLELREIVFSPDSKYVAGVSALDTIPIWEVETGKLVLTLSYPQGKYGFSHAIFSPDGQYLLASADSNAVLWAIPSGKMIRTLSNKADDVIAVGFGSESDYLLTAYQQDGAILWDAQTGEQVRTYPDSIIDPPYQVEFSVDGKYLLTNGDKGVLVWDVQTGKVLHNFGKIGAGSFSSDGKTVFWSEPGINSASLWEVPTFKEISTFQSPDLDYWGLSPDAKYAIFRGETGNLLSIKLWDIPAGIALDTFTLSDQDSIPYQFFPDGKHVLIDNVPNNHTYQLWDILAHKQIGQLVADGYVSALRFSPNGKYLFGATSVLNRWDADTLGEMRPFCG